MKDKLEVGMYVETKLNYIRRIIKVISNYEEFDVYEVDKEFRESEYYESTEILYPDEVINNSFSPIDLVSVGDYVNGSKVIEIEKDYKFIDNEIRDILWLDNKSNNAVWKETIKSIVTKEQFESMSYKLEE